MTGRRGWIVLAAGAVVLVGAVTGREVGASATAAGGAFVLPHRLSDTGLYADAGTLTIDARVRRFAPQYPLWSDGAAKRRWVRLPEGTAIDTRDVNHWDFPVGTRFWKEFAFGGRRVETRMLVKTTAGRWEFAAYAWGEDQRDALLVPAEGLAGVAEVAPGKWHDVPSRDECRACHDSGRTEILGFTALQLSDDRDPLAPHAEPLEPGMLTVRTLADEGRLAPARPELVTTPPRIAAPDARERAVLGYLSANCGSCHNPRSTIASLGLNLQHLATDCVPAAIATSVDQPGHWVVPTAPAGTSRIVRAGRPELSALLYRAASRRPSSQMPPIGTKVADREALELVRAWIASNPGEIRGSCVNPPATH
ncbi:MAG: hypothetical protein AB7U83_14145 [Vicinamibacterales bacterium]